jgi:hypothetical protein
MCCEAVVEDGMIFVNRDRGARKVGDTDNGIFSDAASITFSPPW